MDLSVVIVYGRIWWAVSISRNERPVKLISAVKRAENGEIGAGILDLRIFGSIIGNTVGERPTHQSTDRQNLARRAYRPSFRPLHTFHGESSFRRSDPINSYHIQYTFSARKLAGDTLSNRRIRSERRCRAFVIEYFRRTSWRIVTRKEDFAEVSKNLATYRWSSK